MEKLLWTPVIHGGDLENMHQIKSWAELHKCKMHGFKNMLLDLTPRAKQSIAHYQYAGKGFLEVHKAVSIML